MLQLTFYIMLLVVKGHHQTVLAKPPWQGPLHGRLLGTSVAGQLVLERKA
jgi:hypothetical protein